MAADRSLMNIVLTGLRILIFLNLFFLFVFIAMIVASFLVPGLLFDTAAGSNQAGNLLAFRLVMAIAILTVPFAHVLLTRLRMMVETVRSGDPFVESNARRLQLIAWCLFGIQICDLAFGAVALTLASTTDAMFDWTFSLTGWLAVALLFVLARVFAHGARMREELEGTV